MPRWTPESKLAQRDRIKQTRPWLHSTGPRSIYGKSISRLNAAKPHKRQTLLEPRQFQVGDRVKYIGSFTPTMLSCGDSLEVAGFCSLGTGAIACRSTSGKLIWIYAKDLQRCPDGRQKHENDNQS